MKIAVLGWGSLIWDKRPEFDEQHEDWLLDGPELKLEFSRISKTRANALTLVIDDRDGAKCNVAYAMSKRTTAEDAICDLRSREGTVFKRIGFYFADRSRCCEIVVPGSIPPWAEKKRFDVVIWTGLSSNFTCESRPTFSTEAAIKYLQDLPSEGKAKAAEYVWRAPEFVKTDLRTALENQPWFKV